jgi:hypothetical protein
MLHQSLHSFFEFPCKPQDMFGNSFKSEILGELLASVIADRKGILNCHESCLGGILSSPNLPPSSLTGCTR